MFHSLPSLTPEALFGDGYSSDRTKEWSWDPFFHSESMIHTTRMGYDISMGLLWEFLWDFFVLPMLFPCYIYDIL